MTGRAKPLKFQPRAATRRDKAERDAIAEAESERLAARQSTATQSHPAGASRGANARGRGALRKFQGSPPIQHASGPLGAGNTKEKLTPDRRRTRGGSVVAASGGPDNVVRLPSDNVDVLKNHERKACESGATPSATSKINIKKVELSSINVLDRHEKDERNLKLDISYISLLDSGQDENDFGDEANADHKDLESRTSASVRNKEREQERSWHLRPIRLDRQEHVGRQIEVNTDASSAISAKLRKRAQEKKAKTEVFVHGDDANDLIEGAYRHDQAMDLEHARVEQPWQGVWQPTTLEEGKSAKHEEQTNRSRSVILPENSNRVSVSLAQDDAEEATRPQNSHPIGVEPSYKAEDSPHSRNRKSRQASARQNVYRDTKSNDKTGWEVPDIADDKDFSDLINVWKDFQNPQKSARNNNDTGQQRSSQTYIIQLPPVLPRLHNATLTEEARLTPHLNVNNPSKRKSNDTQHFSICDNSSSSQKDSGDIRTPPAEPHLKHTDSVRAEDMRTSSQPYYTVNDLHPPSGHIGKLKVYASGHMIATWGGTPLVIKEEECKSNMAQEIVVMEGAIQRSNSENIHQARSADPIGQEDGTKKAFAMGPIKAGFIAALDWNSILLQHK